MDEEDSTKDRLWCQMSLAIEIAKVRSWRYNLDFQKDQRLYIPSGLGARSIPWFLKFLKFASRPR